ncbi:MAG: stage III sporulation protein AA [Eubacteriales bacterium]|nr:stage III sporulation protein AA [Eubacteriales bacterium]
MQRDRIFSLFPEKLREALRQMNVEEQGLQEIRIRVGRPVAAWCEGRERLSGRSVDRQELQELLAYLGNYSLYAYEDEIRQGFLSLPGGHRVGLAGRVILENGRIRTMTDISSLNIRFARQVAGCGDGVLPYLWQDGRLCHTLIASAPGKGKTTLLRDCIRQISNGSLTKPGMTVGLVDERSEIAGTCRGEPGSDVGLRTDVLDACPKAEGMMMLIRSMAPKVVAVDEIGGRDDADALRYAMNCGCVLLATVHGGSMEELLRKPVLRELTGEGMFERYVFLRSKGPPGVVERIADREGRTLC